MNVQGEKKLPVVWLLLGSISILIISMEASDLRRMIELTSIIIFVLLACYFWHLMGSLIGLGIIALVDSKIASDWANKMNFDYPKVMATKEFLITFLVGTVYLIVMVCFWQIVSSKVDFNRKVLFAVGEMTIALIPFLGLFLRVAKN